MNKILTVSQMHCAGCVGLIRLELEESLPAEIRARLVDVRLVDQEAMRGEVEFAELADQEQQQVIRVIEALGEYRVIGSREVQHEESTS